MDVAPAAARPGIGPDSGFHRDLADRIRKVIEHSGISQAVFAVRVGLDSAMLSSSLFGSRNWRIEEIMAIADQAGTTTEWLLTGRGNRDQLPAQR